MRKPEAATVDRIVAVAEKMFAEYGYRGVSLRAVMRECGVNAAAIHYHFGSKEALLEEIFVRRAGALNSARLRLLDSCMQSESADSGEHLELILHAFLSPAFSLPDGDEGVRRFTRLRSVIAHENAELSQQLVSRHFNETSGYFIAALRRALPHLSHPALLWRFHFLLGAQYYTLSNPGRIESLSAGSCDASDLQSALDELVAFVAAGFRASSPKPRRRTRGTRVTQSAQQQHDARIGKGAEKRDVETDIKAAGKSPQIPRQAQIAYGSAVHTADAQISDAAWSAIASLLNARPARVEPSRGRKPISDREALSGIVYVMRHRLRWRDLSVVAGFRSGASCWRRLREWEANGVWQQIAGVLREQLPDGRELDFAIVERPHET
ncbi:transposase [Paraburkholderia sp. ZP32-5]|uniref:transposase n=1 Tax=Paraburkholderia sp. ZP32-5 TaxID=2883245 RepID=UPI001F1D6791|nr:transposase [Paraburkholderia sp. ZP32-5]